MSVSERIYKRREELGFSQTDLANKAGLKPPAISQYESGVRTPSYEALIKLSNSLNVTTDYLISGKEVSADSINDVSTKLLLKIVQGLSAESKNKLLEYAIFISNSQSIANDFMLNESDLADFVLKNYSSNQLPIDVYEIAKKLNISIFEDDMEGDGEGLLIKSSKNIIILNRRTKHNSREKFTISILIGHAVIPWHTKSTYLIRKSGSSTLHTEDVFEMEAQDFAARLLMPQNHIVKDFLKTKATIENLKMLADKKYYVSLFALANRLVDYDKDRFAVIQSDNWNVVKTFQGNRPLVEKIDPNSFASTFIDNPSEVEEIRKGEVSADCWLLDSNGQEKVFEESIYNPQYKRVLTLLTLEKLK